MKHKPSLSSLKRKKLPSLAKLKRDLDKAFSRYIRLRACDGCNRGICVTCGSVVDYSAANAGHFIARQHLATRYDERNVHLQCVMCNLYKHGNLINYTLFMQNRYGQEVVDELMRLKRTSVKLSRGDYEELLQKYS
jgi:5-methylcytosine-specific restriction endonuclease McrA